LVGEVELSEFLQQRFGPNGITPWNMRYNSSDRVGLIAQQQQLEAYYGQIKPNIKLGRDGVLKTNAGFAYLLREGFASLLSWDCKRIGQIDIPHHNQRFYSAIQSITPEHMTLSLLMTEDDTISTVLPTRRFQTFFAVIGFLCNGPTHIGKKISSNDIIAYATENTLRRAANNWEHSYERYIYLTKRFCLVRPIHEYADSSRGARKEVAHLLSLPVGTYFCNCHLYWSRLDCPASLSINNKNNMIVPPLETRIQNSYYAGRDTSLATPHRRRTNRPMPQGRYNLLWTALGVPADYDDPILKFMYITSKGILSNAARLRKIPRRELKTKAESIIHIMAGTALGNKVIIDGSITHQQLYKSRHRSQHNSYLVESGLLLDQATEYNAMFHPFPEGVDDGNPDSCKTFWITIPNVNTIVHQIHIVSFLFACKHVSLRGFGGRVIRESLLTSQDLLSKLCIFVQNNDGQTESLSEFLDLFHNEYLASADSTYHELRIPRDINMEQRKQLLKTQVRLFLSLLEIPNVQEDKKNNLHKAKMVKTDSN
jgi:hypothetical protein